MPSRNAWPRICRQNGGTTERNREEPRQEQRKKGEIHLLDGVALLHGEAGVVVGNPHRHRRLERRAEPARRALQRVHQLQPPLLELHVGVEGGGNLRQDLADHLRRRDAALLARDEDEHAVPLAERLDAQRNHVVLVRGVRLRQVPDVLRHAVPHVPVDLPLALDELIQRHGAEVRLVQRRACTGNNTENGQNMAKTTFSVSSGC